MFDPVLQVYGIAIGYRFVGLIAFFLKIKLIIRCHAGLLFNLRTGAIVMWRLIAFGINVKCVLFLFCFFTQNRPHKSGFAAAQQQARNLPLALVPCNRTLPLWVVFI